MNIGTVRRKIVPGISAVILLIVALCAFAYMQLRAIEGQALELRAESVPGMYLAGELYAVSVSTFTSFNNSFSNRILQECDKSGPFLRTRQQRETRSS